MADRSVGFGLRVSTRRRFLAAGAASAGLAVGSKTRQVDAAASVCTSGIPALLDTLLIAEQVAMTLYFTGLTTRAVVGHPYLAGTSADPNRVASNGNPVNVASMQATLDQERQHARILLQAGAATPYARVYFPASTFAGLGYTRTSGTFLWVVDQIETALVGGYLTLIHASGMRKQPNLVQLAARILGTEAQHRVLGRVVSGDTPANNLGLEVNSFTCGSEIQSYLQRYLTGNGFVDGATAPIPVPSPADIARVVGEHRSR